MTLFCSFQKHMCVVAGCAALLVASPHAAAMPLSHAQPTDTVAERAWAADTDPGGRIYVELLNMQDKTIDQAAVAVEAAHAGNTHLAFVLSILVTVMGAACAWLLVANVARRWMTPRTGA